MREQAHAHALTLDKGIIHVFCDGASSLDKATGLYFGGWGAVLYYNSATRELFGSKHGGTNQEMELQAIYEGMKAIKDPDKRVVFYSDSQYSINCITAWGAKWRKNGWVTGSGTDVAHRELIEAILDLKTPQMKFKWVKGHAGHPCNELADRLAVQGRTALATEIKLARGESVEPRFKVTTKKGKINIQVGRQRLALSPALAQSVANAVTAQVAANGSVPPRQRTRPQAAPPARIRVRPT